MWIAVRRAFILLAALETHGFPPTARLIKRRHRASGPCSLFAGAGEGQSCRADCCAASRMEEIGSESERGSNHAGRLPGSGRQRCRDVLCRHRWIHLFQASSVSLSPFRLELYVGLTSLQTPSSFQESIHGKSPIPFEHVVNGSSQSMGKNR